VTEGNLHMLEHMVILIEIDRVLAHHYGSVAEELDFVINDDVKYRTGSELEEGKEWATNSILK
jgi:hypothetical protein